MISPMAQSHDQRPSKFELFAVIDKDLGMPFDESIMPKGDYSKSRVHSERKKHEYIAHLVKDTAFAEGTHQMW